MTIQPKSIFHSALSVGLFATLIAGSANLSLAQQLSNRWIFDKPYANVGDWRIVGSSDAGDTCVAEIDNAQVSLRVMFTYYTGDWFFGNPYYESDNPTASFGIGERDFTNVSIEMRTDVVEGWAMFNFTEMQQILSELSDGRYLSLNLDRGVQSWQMFNTTEVIAELEECAQNMGNKPANATVSAAPPKPTRAPQPVPLANNGHPCPAPGSIKSPGSNVEVLTKFHDLRHTERAKTVYWVGFDGELVEMGPTHDGNMTLKSYAGHKFLVKDSDGLCYGGVYEVLDTPTTFTVN